MYYLDFVLQKSKLDASQAQIKQLKLDNEMMQGRVKLTLNNAKQLEAQLHKLQNTTTPTMVHFLFRFCQWHFLINLKDSAILLQLCPEMVSLLSANFALILA